jgi:hypothetical protein
MNNADKPTQNKGSWGNATLSADTHPTRGGGEWTKSTISPDVDVPPCTFSAATTLLQAQCGVPATTIRSNPPNLAAATAPFK